MTSQLSRNMFFLAATLLLCGLFSSIYLTYLYVLVEGGADPTVDSFCALSERVNCVTVACCKYSTLFTIPISVYGIEYHLLLLGLLLLSKTQGSPLKHCESLLFILSGLSLPACAVLAYVSFFVIDSVCPLCCLVYASNLLLFLGIGFSAHWNIQALVTQGPKDLLCAIGKSKKAHTTLIVLILLAFSQFFWMPQLFEFKIDLSQTPQSGQGSDETFLGPEDAPVRIIEFSDFECFFCAKAHRVISELFLNYPDKIYYEHRNYPMDASCNPHIKRPFHKNACRAARYALCAAEQKQFQPFQEMLWNNQRKLSENNLKLFAQELKLNQKHLDECLRHPQSQQRILDDIEKAELFGGVSGTPTFFVNGERIVGFREPEFWEKKVKEILEQGEPETVEGKSLERELEPIP